MGPATFSIVAADLATGEIGVAVASRFLSVGAVVPFVRAGAGAIATQAFANTAYGPQALELLAAGKSPDEIGATLIAGDPGLDERQFGIVAVDGRSATFTGSRCIDWAGGIAGDGFAAQGNCLAGAAVVDALAAAFRGSRGHLADRLVGALQAAEAKGGDKRGRQSAALVIEKPRGGYAGFNDRYVDLRVDDHANPIDELGRLLEMHKLYFFEAAPEDLVDVDTDVGTQIVAELKRIGVLGPDAFAYDAAARAALVGFMHVENLENRVRDDGKIDRQTLGYLRSAPAKLQV